MKNDEDLVIRFKETLKKDSGANISIEEAKVGLTNIAKFFELLWQYDLADKRKEMLVEI